MDLFQRAKAAIGPISAYLPADRETAGWLAFAGREVALQLRRQFHPDGTNFEASTCYHRLSAEMMVYGTALMLCLARERPGDLTGWWSNSAPRFHPPPPAPRLPSMENAAGAEKIFASEPAANADAPRLGDSARLYSQSLVFRKGPYLVRITAYEDSPETKPALLGLARSIEQRLTKEPRLTKQ